MKLICPWCQYEAFVDAASVSAGEEVVCARCGGSLRHLLWGGSQLSALTTATANTNAAAAPAAAALVNQRIMENQNGYAPSAETGFEDVLDIPGPLRPAQETSDQALVLEDVIPVQDLSAAAEPIEPGMHGDDEQSDASEAFEQEDAHHSLIDSPTASLQEKEGQAGPEVAGAPEAASFDYEGSRAWLRVAPLLLLGAALVFFALYYLGNRVGGGPQTRNAATSPATPETQSAATQGSAPAAVESAPEASQTTSSSADDNAVSNVPVVAEVAPQTQPENKKVEPARNESRPANESKPVADAPQPAPAASAPAAPAPADQAAGNYTIQVGSYNDAAQADERAGRLRANGVEARVVKAEIPRRGTWYRVQTGRFASQEEATRRAAELKG
ncbi:MAG TPA: SPOR domain-containing protein, partial [Pyrinomonadaceae bacterium]|nr:SPOR domain-containing protein [Pyrinomonadaceae bacterium]